LPRQSSTSPRTINRKGGVAGTPGLPRRRCRDRAGAAQPGRSRGLSSLHPRPRSVTRQPGTTAQPWSVIPARPPRWKRRRNAGSPRGSQTARPTSPLDSCPRWRTSNASRTPPRVTPWRHDLRPGLSDVVVPMLLMRGWEDQVVSVSQAAETADNAPGAKIHVLGGCGHLPRRSRGGAAGVLLDFFTPTL
jgi:pimeloyl-ACP methyl ester carboxylesterase